jgi:ATP-dependent DNA helicase RecQ
MSTDPLLVTLKENFGYLNFRQLQREVIEHVVSGKNALVLFPTGAGKSLCFQIPSIVMDGVGIVISPLISLMQDQVDNLKKRGVRAEFLNSSLKSNEIERIEYALQNNEIDLLYISPERLNKRGTINFLKTLKISLFTIDEVHSISQFGHSFREDYMKLHVIPEHFPDVPILGMTATADSAVKADILRTLKMENDKVFVTSFDRPNIYYEVKTKSKGSELKQTLDYIKRNHRQSNGIVYCMSRKSTEEINQHLQDNGINSVAYHAGFKPEERNDIQRKFIGGQYKVIVATLASFGVGIDHPYIDFVINIGLPKTIEEYYQSSGRGGRSSQSASSLLLWSQSDVTMLRRWINETNSHPDQKRIENNKLDAMVSFAEQYTCRRVSLLKYFDEHPNFKKCGKCDNCR